LLDGAQHDRHLLVYLDEAHIHQDADLGYGWGAGRLWVASSSPGLSARVSFDGLSLSNEGQVRLWPYHGPMVSTRSRCCVGSAPRLLSAR
jgi:hypothetical protein